MSRISTVRGMHDISPDETPMWQRVEGVAREVLASYGYREMRPPVVEHTELFVRSVGEGTDIVDKEMYTFTDRSGDSLTLRPECTASCVRAAVEHTWLRGRGQRLWHIGPMFRHEKPQKERYRQFYQLDVEALGYPGPDVDAELILLSHRLWRELGLTGIQLKVNSLGSRPAQVAYRDKLVAYFSAHESELDDDSRRRLTTNPLRILDSKNETMRALIADAPVLLDHVDDESRAHFDQLRRTLDAAGLEHTVDTRLVRGLDYYTRTVFEWVSDGLGAQNAVCGGGRYDNLIEDIGGQAAPAIGFALGLERLVALMHAQERAGVESAPHAYLLAAGERAPEAALPLAERLRDAVPGMRLVVDAGPGSFKSKLKRADRSGAALAFILGDDEIRSDSMAVKPLREQGEQVSLSWAEAGGYLAERLALG